MVGGTHDFGPGLVSEKFFVPTAPLERAVKASGRAVLSIFGKTRMDAYTRAARRGYVRVDLADSLAVALGYHPSEIWGNEWWSALNPELDLDDADLRPARKQVG